MRSAALRCSHTIFQIDKIGSWACRCNLNVRDAKVKCTNIIPMQALVIHYSPFTFRKSLTQNLLAFQSSTQPIIYIGLKCVRWCAHTFVCTKFHSIHFFLAFFPFYCVSYTHFISFIMISWSDNFVLFNLNRIRICMMASGKFWHEYKSRDPFDWNWIINRERERQWSLFWRWFLINISKN